MKLRKVRNRLLFVVASGVLALGCELIVDFDRTKIPADGKDAATSDSSVDASIDTSQPDSATTDSGGDAPSDGPADAADAADAADGD